MTDEKEAAVEALRAEYERLDREHSDADILPEGIDQRLSEFETTLAELDERPVQYNPEENARAGALRQHRRVGGAADRGRLDVAAAGWWPTVDNYLGRVTKARIPQSRPGAKGETAAQLTEHLKTCEMAERAQELLTGARWLPEPLSTRDRSLGAI
ncbi:hypothetical protein JQ625_06880 [Bradyrhizobium diazoefficiens]|nr:hypothetical protein [Bradyrhizobium diazoefficiens]